MMEAHDRFYLEESDFDRTIAIDALGVGTTEFDLPRERAMQLYGSGRAGAEEFLCHKWAGPRGFPRSEAA
jgi:NTE family protein